MQTTETPRRKHTAEAISCLFLLSLLLLSGCGQPQTSAEKDMKTETESADEHSSSETAKEDDDDEDILDEKPAEGKKKVPAKPKLSSEAKKTGKLIDGVIVHQQNEFLGPCLLKIGKPGVRVESSTITVIFPCGKEPIAYNPQNGNCMALNTKSAGLMSGNMHAGEEYKDHTEKVGTEKIAGVNCTHYLLTRVFVDKKTGKELNGKYATDVWFTRDLKLPPQVIKDCARMIMMPADLGFPVKIEREPKTSYQNSHPNAGRRNVVITNKFESAKIDSGEFAPLAGFSTVKDEMKLMMSDEESELSANAALDDLDK